ncbi:hypothetical protein B0O99DRAFT_261225 [Bisporella sp. PMI_857]|nr:hypothetical protein B0O99DRAFT_261225 [Bisporella sp. PMI_857]
MPFRSSEIQSRVMDTDMPSFNSTRQNHAQERNPDANTSPSVCPVNPPKHTSKSPRFLSSFHYGYHDLPTSSDRPSSDIADHTADGPSRVDVARSIGRNGSDAQSIRENFTLEDGSLTQSTTSKGRFRGMKVGDARHRRIKINRCIGIALAVFLMNLMVIFFVLAGMSLGGDGVLTWPPA